MNDSKTDSTGELVKVRVDATGGELSVGNKTLDLIERFWPNSWISKRKIDRILSDQLIRKIGEGCDLDEGEMEFLHNSLSEQARKFLRQKAIQVRAIQLRDERPPKLLSQQPLAESSEPVEVEYEAPVNAVETSEDWVLKFREDTAYIEDTFIQEIYARILAEESVKPKSVSLRTLGVLRYLDRETALLFEELQNVVFSGAYIPLQQDTNGKKILAEFGLNHSKLLRLSDAGLLHSAQSELPLSGPPIVIHHAASETLFMAGDPVDSTASINRKLKINLLTQAGRELSNLCGTNHSFERNDALIGWLKSQLSPCQLKMGKLLNHQDGNPVNMVVV